MESFIATLLEYDNTENIKIRSNLDTTLIPRYNLLLKQIYRSLYENLYHIFTLTLKYPYI